MRLPDVYAIRGVSGKRDPKKTGSEVWIYWSPEGGGWWLRGPIGWRKTFKSSARAEAVAASAHNAGPWYNQPDTQNDVSVVSLPNPKQEEFEAMLREAQE